MFYNCDRLEAIIQFLLNLLMVLHSITFDRRQSELSYHQLLIGYLNNFFNEFPQDFKNNSWDSLNVATMNGFFLIIFFRFFSFMQIHKIWTKFMKFKTKAWWTGIVWHLHPILPGNHRHSLEMFHRDRLSIQVRFDYR